MMPTEGIPACELLVIRATQKKKFSERKTQIIFWGVKNFVSGA
jgi:hypothetical protein